MNRITIAIEIGTEDAISSGQSMVSEIKKGILRLRAHNDRTELIESNYCGKIKEKLIFCTTNSGDIFELDKPLLIKSDQLLTACSSITFRLIHRGGSVSFSCSTVKMALVIVLLFRQMMIQFAQKRTSESRERHSESNES